MYYIIRTNVPVFQKKTMKAYCQVLALEMDGLRTLLRDLTVSNRFDMR